MEGIKVKVDTEEVTMWPLWKSEEDVIKEDLKINISLFSSKKTTSTQTIH
jgi:hypothetical protein